jgi:pyruvate kinase
MVLKPAAMRHTKIVATVGPASSDPAVIDALIAAGVDVFRLNFSHGSHDSHRIVYARIREAAQRASAHVGVMQDLSGPKIRTGPLEGSAPVPLHPSQELRIIAGDEPSRPGEIYTPFAGLIQSARAGDRLLLDDGRIELRVTEARGDHLRAVVVNGGELGAHKGINAPGVMLPASALTDKDVVDLRFGLALGVDFVALSFVQTADDVRRAADVMAAATRVVPVIAKIERPAAVENLGSILQVAQGVMVARGDLGLEMPLEQVPRIQKEIIARARALGRPSILATQVFESMRSEPRPTRAEVSDAANAVDEGADAIMLAGETAVGAFPVRAVQTLDVVIRDAETGVAPSAIVPVRDPIGSLHGRALCEAAVTLATAGDADAIVAVTNEGKTARLLSSLRPRAPIIAATPDPSVAGALTMLRGVHPFVTPSLDVARLRDELLQRGLIHSGSVVVFANVSPELHAADGTTNFLNVQKM